MPTTRITTTKPKGRPAKPFVPYGRISRLNGREKGANVSIEEQGREIERIARAHRLELLPGLVSDEDVSGSTFDRPGWEQAISLVESGRAGGIVAFDMKRMSRGKTAEVLVMVEDVEAAGGRLYDAHGPVSVEGADDELITTVKAMIARREWRERRAYLDTSVRNAIDRGVHLSAPFGYAKSAGKGTKLAVVPEEAAQVRRAFELRAAGHSWPSIAEQLNASGAPLRPYKRDGETRQAAWTHKTVRQIVGNEVYLGVAYNGDRRHPGAHEEIVTPGLFERANATKGTKPVGPGEGYLLTGLVRCRGCGYAMTHTAQGSKRYYRCRAAQHGDGRCPDPAMCPAEPLEELVWARFEDEYLGGGRTEQLDTDGRVLAAKDALAVAKTRSANAMRLYTLVSSDGERELAEEQVRVAGAGVRDAETELAEANARARGGRLPVRLTAEEARKDSVPERRHYLSLVYAAVHVRRSRVWREPVDDRFGILAVDSAPGGSGAGLRGLVTAQTD